MAALPASLFRFIVPLGIGASLVQASIYDVKGGTRAVIFDRASGVKETVVNEGTHFLIPWLQKAIVYDVRTRPRNISTTTGSKDLQMVTLTLRVLHRPEVKQLPKIYQVRTLPPLQHTIATIRRLHCNMIIQEPALIAPPEPRPRLRRARPPIHRQRSPESHRRAI
jgi:regulator of protease activity HflC (stomatin/prohibitin superfamily)